MATVKPLITVITPTIRPDGLKKTFETLQKQTLQDFQWLPRLSIPGKKPDLCYQMNKALYEAKGDLVVFLQDWIILQPEGLEYAWNMFAENPKACWTFPVGKVPKFGAPISETKWDWRYFWKRDEDIDYQRWEIDFGSAPRWALNAAHEKRGHFFDEKFDDGFGWENVDLAFGLDEINGVRFRVYPDNWAIAWDHDAHIKHPYKDKPNQDAWIIKKTILESLKK